MSSYSDSSGPIEYWTANQVYFIIRVTDLELATEFYTDVFGFNVAFTTAQHVELTLPSPGARLNLNLVEEWRISHGAQQLEFAVLDINAVREYVTGKGVETRDVESGYFEAVEMGRKRGYDYFIMLDPFGNEILFIGNDT